MILTAQRASANDGDDSAGQLYQLYWFPVYSYIRSRGHSRERAEDLTQSFFLELIEKNFLVRVDKSKGRFRSYLLASVTHFLNDEWKREMAIKRGGGSLHLSLDIDRGESLYAETNLGTLPPAELFDRQWARTVFAIALNDLRETYDSQGQLDLFLRLQPLLVAGEDESTYRELAAQLDMSESAIRVAVHRLRKRLGTSVRHRLEETVESSGQVDDELRYLLSLL